MKSKTYIKKIIIIFLPVFLLTSSLLPLETDYRFFFNNPKNTAIQSCEKQSVNSFIAPRSVFSAAKKNTLSSKPFQIRTALKSLIKNLPSIGFYTSLAVMGFFLVQNLLNPALYPVERIALLGLGASVFQVFFLVKSLLKKGKKLFLKPFIYFAIFSTLLTSATSFPQLVEFIPVNEIQEHYYNSNDTKVSEADMARLLVNLYNKNTGEYVMGFESKNELKNFINHNQLFWLTVKNHFQPNGQVIKDPHGILRARFLLLTQEAINTSFPVELLSETELTTQEKNIIYKSILSYILNHGSILRMNVLETPLRDKLGDSPGISHTDLETTINNLRFAEAMFKWSSDPKSTDSFSPELFTTNLNVYLSNITRNNPDQIPVIHQKWSDLAKRSSINSPTYNLDSLEANLTSFEHLPFSIGPINRLNPFFTPERLDSWNSSSDQYTFGNMTTQLSEEGAFWAIRSRLITMFFQSSINADKILNNDQYRHLFPQFIYHYFMTYNSGDFINKIDKSTPAEDIILSPEILFKLHNDIPQEHQTYIFNELFINQGKIFNSFERKSIATPEIIGSDIRTSPAGSSS